jgi:hypothetical protein
VPRRAHPEVKEFNDALHAALEPFDLDLVLLLGFLSPFELRGCRPWSAGSSPRRCACSPRAACASRAAG